MKIEKSMIFRNLDILDEKVKGIVGRFSLDTGGEERIQWEIAKELSWGYRGLTCRVSRSGGS
ncbi:hypothetical protein KIH86_20220 [Paenibacillus sp. HN-1]|nr:hypothetical protein [Paenibacillus sp. CGMCC 1.18879]MBY9086533.1 hypothetical protein [Paenibacillus sinensis]